jgi:CheY-like chemotaxis protein
MSPGPDYNRPVEILLVEDSPSDANLAVAALKEGGVRNRVHHVEDGAEAMAFLRREQPFPDAPRPDLILLDLNLPRMDGYQVLAEVRKDARFRDIPAVVLTASADPRDVEESYKLGANYYITKPADLHEFITTMEAVKDAAAALRRVGVEIDRFLANRVGNLDLSSSPAGDDALAHLRGLTQMKRLWLGHTAITDAGLAHLKDLVHLELLDLEQTAVTDAGLAALEPLTGLRELNLRHTQVTPEAVARLQEQRPELTIER